MANFSLLAKIGIDSKALSSGLKAAKGKVNSFSKSAGSSIKSFSKSAGASFLRMGAAFAGIGLVKSISALGLAAGETASKFKAVFGPATAQITEEVDKLRKIIPSTKAEMQDALATFASMGKAFGLNSKAASMFSVEMVKVAGDIASFHNLPIEEAFGKIRAAVAGEFEGLKQLGIVINEARLKQEGLTLGIWDGAESMNAAQKALAVQSIMIRDLGEANGDAAATANSAANQVKFLQKNLKETGTEIGTTILPAVAMLTKALSGMLSGIQNGMSAMGDFIARQIYMSGLSDVQFTAKMELESSGAFEEAGVDRVGMGAARTAMIKKRAKEIEKEREIEAKAEAERIKASENEIKTSKDLAATLESQIKKETDPKRAKALQERLDALKAIIKQSGNLELAGGGEDTTSEEMAKKELEELEEKIKEIKLEAIRAQASGDKEAQKAAEVRAKWAEKTLSLMKDHNLSLEEAAALAKKVNEISDPEEDRKKKLETLEAKINEMKLKAIHAQANGDLKAQAAMERRAKFAQKIVDLMGEYNISQEQATLIANKNAEAGELTGEGGARSELTGEDLRKASNIAGEGQAPSNRMEDFSRREREAGLNLAGNETMSGRGENPTSLDKEEGDVRFERLAGGGYQQFVDGKKGEKFSEEQMQAGLQKQIDKDPTEALLEKINATLEGKFVSQ